MEDKQNEERTSGIEVGMRNSGERERMRRQRRNCEQNKSVCEREKMRSQNEGRREED